MEVRYKGYGRFLDMGSKKLYFALKLATMWIDKGSKGRKRISLIGDVRYVVSDITPRETLY